MKKSTWGTPAVVVAVFLVFSGRTVFSENRDSEILDHLHVGSVELRIESIETEGGNEGQPVRRVPGFDTRGYSGVVSKAGREATTVGLGLEVVRPKDSSEPVQIAAVIHNSIEDLVVVLETTPACCSDALPWSRGLSFPLELDIGESRALLMAEPQVFVEAHEIKLEVVMEDGGRHGWTIMARDGG